MSKCGKRKMDHLQNILFGEADQLFLYGAGLLLSPSSSHWSRKGKLALDQESLSDSEDVALIRKSEKVSFGRRDQFWLGKSSTWKGSVSHNSLETGGWLEIYTLHRLHRLEVKLESFERTFDHLLTNFKRSTSGTCGTPYLPELTKECFQLSGSLARDSCALAAKVWLWKTKAKSNTSWFGQVDQLSVEENKGELKAT